MGQPYPKPLRQRFQMHANSPPQLVFSTNMQESNTLVMKAFVVTIVQLKERKVSLQEEGPRIAWAYFKNEPSAYSPK